MSTSKAIGVVGLLDDREIRRLATEEAMIHPYNSKSGNSYGYDLTLADEFLVPRLDTEQQVVDPFNPPEFSQVRCESFIIVPPGSFVLGRSVEWVKMPRDVMGICLGRSTYARAAVITNVTPLEPGWEGRVTMEITNSGRLPVKVHVGRGIVQVVFFRGERPPMLDYVQGGGRYHMQEGVQQGRPE